MFKDAFTLGVGGLVYQKATDNKYYYLIDVMFEMKMNELLVKLGADYGKREDDTENGYGVNLMAAYEVTEKLAVGLRGEYFAKFHNQKDTIGITFGPKYKMTDNLTAKVNYLLKVVSGASPTHTGLLSAVYAF